MSANYAAVDLELTLANFDNVEDALATVKRAREAGLRAKLDALDSGEVEVEISVDLASEGQETYDRIKAVQTLLVQVTNVRPS